MADVEEIEIKLKVDDSEVKKALSDNTEVKETKTGGGKSSGMVGKGAEDTGDTVFDEAKYHSAFGMVGAAVSNPQVFIGKMLPKLFKKMLPRLLTKFIPVVGAAFLALEVVPIIIKEVVKQLTSVGAPFDKRWKRNVKKEVNAFFSREEQQRRRLGLDPVIMTTVVGFKNNGGLRTVNTLNQVRETGISSIGLEMKAQGVQP